MEAYEQALQTCEGAADYAQCARQVWLNGGFSDIYEENKESLLACVAAGNAECVDQHKDAILAAQDQARELNSTLIHIGVFPGEASNPNLYSYIELQSYYGISLDQVDRIQDTLCNGLTANDYCRQLSVPKNLTADRVQVSLEIDGKVSHIDIQIPFKSGF